MKRSNTLLKRLLLLLFCGGTIFLIGTSAAYSLQSEIVDFTRDIQPIFKQACYRCHSGENAQAGLRLDSKSGALKGGRAGAAIIPGNSKASLLVKRLLGAGSGPRMPLVGEPLAPEKIAIISAWIDQGAPWHDETAAGEAPSKKHWAFLPPTRPAIPPVKNKRWVRNPIDSFILARLEKEGLSPSPPASKEALLRRVSLDLTGLPPTIEEIDNFLADRSTDAYQRVVERLLASLHYGERWGRHWLDVARYADTNGFEKDLPRSIWPYRDWVINALNRDMPFDQFTIEQIAGDLLPDATLEQKVATGFLRNSMLNEEGGVDPEQFRIEEIIDRVDTIGKAFLGLTINCAQCHSHKYDPISQTEYYRFFAFLNNTDEPEIEVPGEEVNKKRAEILGKIKKIEDDLIAGDSDLPRRIKEWEEQARKQEVKWTALEDTDVFGAFGVKFDRLEDHSFLAKGDKHQEATYTLTARTRQTNITGFRLELLTDPSLPRTGPGRSPDGSLVLSEFTVEASPVNNPDSKTRVVLKNAAADFSQANFPVKDAIDGNLKTGWGIDAGPGRRNQDREAVFEPQQPVGFDGGTILNFHLSQKQGNTLIIGRFRISITTDKWATLPRPLPAKVRRIISMPASQRTEEQQREVFSYYLTIDPKFAEANREIDELMRQWPYGPTTLALAERKTPRVTRVFKRGNFRAPGEPVAPGVPAVLHPFPEGAPLNRLGLAKWLVDRKNPLTPRVIVNRIWQSYFGQGLVATPEDFGTRSERPSHAELLDWLACEFRDNGWSLKAIHRLIVLSATYRQSSRITPKLRQVDPQNRLLARAPRLRVEAEIIRDIALAASGLLSRRIGGPSVYPPIPDGVLNLGYGRPMEWKTSTGEDRYRRALYTFWKRSVPYPSLLAFDSPNADFSCVRRTVSNTPLQALVTLNDPVFMEAAQALALRAWREGGPTSRSRAIYAFRLCTGRRPDPIELNRMLTFVQRQSRQFQGHTAAAVYTAAPDLNNLPPDIDLHRLAPWTLLSRALLNMDETITKE